MNTLNLADHDIAALVVFYATLGEYPTWAPTKPIFLGKLRDCTEAEAAEMIAAESPASTLLDHIQGIMPHLPKGKNLVLENVVADIAGWPVSRAKMAIQVAQHAGYLTSGTERVRS